MSRRKETGCKEMKQKETGGTGTVRKMMEQRKREQRKWEEK